MSNLPAQADPAKDEPAALLKTFVSEFVEIKPGTDKFPKSFVMGTKDGLASEQPAHEVTFDYSFEMARYEVPQNLYEAVMGKNPSRWKGPRNSAEMFSWNDARKFCEKITTQLQEAKLIGKDEVIRLPTEAEWEYCCRAGTKTAYSFGDEATAEGDKENKASLLDPYGWHTGNAAGNDPPVGALKPNPWGLYDMHGYLSEFVADSWQENYENAPKDGSALTIPKEPMRVIRGGSWRDRYEKLRSAARASIPADTVTEASDAIGFRCVKAKVAK